MWGIGSFVPEGDAGDAFSIEEWGLGADHSAD